ncbi:hypothetical protein HQ520_10415 [bacterium]|nr:hypothetical protein [bacterium]
MNRRGFTFLELTILVMILGILCLLALPSLDSALVDARLSAGASEVKTALDYARNVACFSAGPTRVMINPALGLIRVEQMKTQNLALSGQEATKGFVENRPFQALEHPIRSGSDYDVCLTDSRYGGVRITSALFGSGNVVTFDTFGLPSTTGLVVLALGKRKMDVTLDSVTGNVVCLNHTQP